MEAASIHNFRCFGEQQSVRLAPLTLLVGDNSTGKTSFLAMIRALAELVEAGVYANNGTSVFSDGPYDLGSFDEIIHNPGTRDGIPASFEAGVEFRLGQDGTRPSDDSLSYEFKFSRQRTVPKLEGVRIAHRDNSIHISQESGFEVLYRIRTRRGEWQWKGSEIEGDQRVHMSLPTPQAILFEGLIPQILPVDRAVDSGVFIPINDSPMLEREDYNSLRTLLRHMRDSRFRHRVFSGSPVRSNPMRTYDRKPVQRTPDGAYVPLYLADLSSFDQARWEELKDSIERFGKDSGLFDELSIRHLGKSRSDPFQMQIRKFGPKIKGLKRNITDVGYGVSQVLPVITELFRHDRPPAFLLQQPEIHLHPSAQAALGSLFCQIASWDRQLFVETHSDFLLNRVRMDVRDGRGRLKPDDVSVLFFERLETSVRIHSLRFDQQGNVLNAPPSYGQFFMNEVTKSIGL